MAQYLSSETTRAAVERLSTCAANSTLTDFLIFRRAREAALYPPEWLFKVWAVVDHPAGSGASWAPEKRIIPGKNAIGVQIDIIAPSPDVARAFVADALREAGHSKWLVTKIQRRDKETETAREIVREALERARLGT